MAMFCIIFAACISGESLAAHFGHDMKAQKTATKTQMYFQQKR